MTAALLLSGVLGAGLWLIVMGQPIGRPRPDLALALQRLSAQGRGALGYDAAHAPMFSSPLLERTLRPLLDDAGNLLGRVLRRAGIEAGNLEARLALAMPEMTAEQFRGQQLATGAITAGAFPLMNLLGVQPAGAWPVWIWLAGFALGFAAPSWQLHARLRRRRLAVLAETPVALDLFVLAASAGLSPEQALVEAGRQLDGVLGDGLREVVREAGLGTLGYAAGLDGLAVREDVPELRSLADAWRLAREQGMPLAPAMLALAESARDRQRSRLLEEGGKAAVRMLFPIVVFIFPVFLVVLLYPAGVQLLGIGR
ncbi:MAG: hypothetical protein C4558_09000 [Dehalococcoidia bacterium]|nr:MAG: hypothetical protein C4558_09000 [Dehalococcoidia bacterium]